jgi:hypothetical protein
MYCSLAFLACEQPAGPDPKGPQKPADITWTAAADGEAGVATSTAITITFDKAVEGLSAEDVRLSGDVTKGALAGSGASWSIALDAVGSAGDVAVSIAKEGVESGDKSVAVYKLGEIADLTWTAAADGAADTVTSTAITFSFSGVVGGLAAQDISVIPGTGSAGVGDLTGGGAAWTLALTAVESQGNLTVSVTKAGIESGGQPVAVHKAAVASRSLTGFSIAALPDTLVYALRQPFDSTGLVIEGIYSDGTAGALEPAEYTLTPPDTSAGGLKNVKVSVGEFKAQYFQVTVRNDTKVLQSIAVAKPPAKTVYGLGEELDLGGIQINGTYYDSAAGSTSVETITAAKTTGYDKKKRGAQTIGVTVNGIAAPAGFTVAVQVPASAALTLNHYRRGSSNHQRDEMKPAYIKGRDFDLAASNLQATVTTASGLKLTFTPANGGIIASDIVGYNKNSPGPQTLTLQLDQKSETFSVEVLDAEPAVWFDYGYMRHQGDPGGAGPGAGKYYAKPNETLVLAPVRFLIGYGDDHSDTGVNYSWSVSGASAYTASASAAGEYYTFTPAAEGTYRVEVTVSGRSYVTGQNVSKSASTEVVCYTGTVPADKPFGENPSKAYPYLRHFAPSQFTESGSGFGWSLGGTGGYEVWKVEHQASYHIRGNPFLTWSEPGVVWVQEDKNGNNVPDETWYELKGGEDEKAAYKGLIRRRYAITYFNSGGGGQTNEYGQLIRTIHWADAKGRTGLVPGGWPEVWGVKGNWVTYTCTLLRDTGNICNDKYPNLDDSWGYVDACNLGSTDDRITFYVSDAVRADGVSVTLSAVRFIKVQTAVLFYGGIFGEISTEINSADFLGGQTSFPLPEDSDPM